MQEDLFFEAAWHFDTITHKDVLLDKIRRIDDAETIEQILTFIVLGLNGSRGYSGTKAMDE